MPTVPGTCAARLVQNLDCHGGVRRAYTRGMYRYGQFCPIAAACEFFAERWTPLLLRELLSGSHRFNELQRGLPLMSRTLLAQRLRELESAGVVERRPKTSGRGFEYHLSEAGEALGPIVLQLGDWGQRWVYARISKDDLDPGLLMWDMRRRIEVEALPSRRVVVQFNFRGLPHGAKGMKHWWLLLDASEVELCMQDPGHELDLLVHADLYAMTQVWTGEQSFADALRQGTIQIQGPPKLARSFPGWLKLGYYANRRTIDRA